MDFRDILEETTSFYYQYSNISRELTRIPVLGNGEQKRIIRKDKSNFNRTQSLTQIGKELDVILGEQGYI